MALLPGNVQVGCYDAVPGMEGEGLTNLEIAEQFFGGLEGNRIYKCRCSWRLLSRC